MIKRLRRKFILVAMCSMAAVLIIIIGTVNIVNYSNIDKSSDAVISVLEEHDGEFPSAFPQAPDFNNGMTAETPFETRYFTVTISGGAYRYDLRKISAVSEADARAFTDYVISKGKTKGMYKDFKYVATQTAAGDDMYIFLDCGKAMDTFRTFLTMSVLISAGGLVVVLGLIVLLSRFALRPAEESYLKQKSFITNASHDIKTPLTVINAEAELIEMEQGETECTAEIKNQVARLTALTEKLVFLSRMEENPQYEFKEFNLTSAVEETLSPYARMAGAQGFTFKEEIQPDITLKGNEELVRRCVGLMLDNALKYAKEGGVIFIGLKKVGKVRQLTFYNEAEDVPVGNRKEFFERFYRGDKSRSVKRGNGIGLSVVRAIAEIHKGKAQAVSEDGKSITFTIDLNNVGK